MTNEEVYQRAYDEIRLQDLSPHTVEGYLGELSIFLRFFDNRPIDSMGEEEIREFLLYQLDSGKSSSTVNIYNSASDFLVRGPDKMVFLKILLQNRVSI